MKNTQENEIKNAFETLCPDVFEEILSECEKKGSDKMLNMQKRRTLRALLIAAAALLLVAALVVGGVFLLKRPEAPVDPTTDATVLPPVEAAATVYIDVNPSLEIDVDDQKTVLSVTGINDDGKALLFDRDYTGQKLEGTLGSLIQVMMDQGYLSKNNSGVLLSVNSISVSLEKELCTLLSSTVNGLLKDSLPDAKVTVQTFKTVENIKDLSETYGISPGKAKYILSILDASGEYDLRELIGASVSDLITICEKLNLPTSDNDIGIQNAIRIAAEDAGITENFDELTYRTTGSEEELLRYELIFSYRGYKYYYTIDADTGKIVDKKTVSTDIGEKSAYAAALDRLGISDEDVVYYAIDHFEFDQTGSGYRVTVQTDSKEYRLLVDVATGEVKQSKEYEVKLHTEQYVKIVYDDLGLPYTGRFPGEDSPVLPEYGAGDSCKTPYTSLHLVCVGLNEKEKAVYIINEEGEILYKEIAENNNAYSVDQAIAMATAAAKTEGSEKIEYVGISYRNGILITLLEDGKKVVYELNNGLINSRTPRGADNK